MLASKKKQLKKAKKVKLLALVITKLVDFGIW
jgi:hypothetical protein